jgi:alkylation response protein AidB-like acyl-CoA dehydrogenase
MTAPVSVAAPTTTAAELAELQDTVRQALRSLSPPEAVRTTMDSPHGWETHVWKRLCGELGVVGLAVPEQLGGSGLSWREQAVVLEEAGAALLCAPLFATAALAVPLLLAAGEGAHALIPPLCRGERTATVLFGAGPFSSQPLSARSHEGTWTVSGTIAPVVDGATADDLLVVAEGPTGPVLLHLDAAQPDVAASPLVSLDLTRRQAKLSLAAASASLLSDAALAPQVLEEALRISRALLAAEEVGVAQRALDMTVAYAKSRVQFGRPIGSFQAVKQKAADMLIKVESARSAAHAAAQAVSTGTPDPGIAPLVAAAFCAEAAVAVTSEAIQLHGGIGFTWEHDAHLYFKRARTDRELLGRPSGHVRQLADELGPASTRGTA